MKCERFQFFSLKLFPGVGLFCVTDQQWERQQREVPRPPRTNDQPLFTDTSENAPRIVEYCPKILATCEGPLPTSSSSRILQKNPVENICWIKLDLRCIVYCVIVSAIVRKLRRPQNLKIGVLSLIPASGVCHPPTTKADSSYCFHFAKILYIDM